jgi:hypothetical protein
MVIARCRIHVCLGSIVVAREARAHVRRPGDAPAVGDFMLDKRSHRYFKADCFFFVFVFRIIFTLKKGNTRER